MSDLEGEFTLSHTKYFSEYKANPLENHAFFDGIYIETDNFSYPFQDRVLPILPEEQVFICRQMTETLKKMQEKLNRPLNVLDIGTGSGVLAIWADRVLNQEQNGQNSQITVLDLSERAIAMAKKNCEYNHCHNMKFLDAPHPYSKDSVKLDSQDVIFVNPPFNPTYPKLEHQIALHARAGDIGMKVFEEWIDYIPDHIKSDGVIIGYQMSPVDQDENIISLKQLSQKLGQESTINYCSILSPDDYYSTKDFLNKQYSDYLLQLRESELKDLEKWIKEISEKFPSLTVIYYEATSSNGKGEIVPDIEPIWKHESTWEDRISLHRKIVNSIQSYPEELPLQTIMSIVPVHSTKNTDFELQQQLWDLRAKNQDTSKVEEDLLKGTILQDITKYLEESVLLKKLDFILVDATPILPGKKSFLRIHEEAALWIGDNIKDKIDTTTREELLRAYQLTTVRLQRSRLAPFFHPVFFSPQNYNRGWGRGWISKMLDEDPIFKNFQKKAETAWKFSQNYLDNYFQKITIPETEEQENIFCILQARKQEQESFIYSTAKLVNLVDTKGAYNGDIGDFFSWKDYLHKLRERKAVLEKLSSNLEPSFDLDETDFRACQWVMHRYLQSEADRLLRKNKLIKEGQKLLTWLVALPLLSGVLKNFSIAELLTKLDKPEHDSELLPQEYYGGVWFWGGIILAQDEDYETSILSISAPLNDLGRFTLIDLANTYGRLEFEAFQQLGSEWSKRRLAHHTYQLIASMYADFQRQGLFQKMKTSTWCSLIILKGQIARYRDYYNYSIEFPGIGNDPIEEYSLIAAANGLERALESSSRTPKLCRQKAINLKRQESETFNPATQFLQQLGWTAPQVPDLAIKTLKTEGFGIMLVYCLGQAFYHSFRCLSTQPDLFKTPKMELRVNNTSLTVEIQNPGQPSPQKSKDADEYKEWGHFFGTKSVSGPEWNENLGSWLTSFIMDLID